MAPSPRKSAPPAFDPAWHETHTAFLDPSSLPVSRAPRAWEHKQETKVTSDGKEKKVWRRYTLRSQSTNTLAPDEEHDSRSRPVKRLQHMSPRAMRTFAAIPKGQKPRAFQAMRYDRWKTALPRKKKALAHMPVTHMDDENDIIDNILDATDTTNTTASDVSNNTFTEQQLVQASEPAENPTVVEENMDRRSTFTFRVHEERNDEMTESHKDLSQASPESGADDDNTLMYLFGSPVKGTTSLERDLPVEDVTYPSLPEEYEETGTTCGPESIVIEDVQILEDLSEESNNARAATVGLVQERVESTHNLEEEQIIEPAPTDPTEVFYPLLDPETLLQEKTESPEEVEEAQETDPAEDEEMSDIMENSTEDASSEQYKDENELEDSAGTAQDEFTLTEASLQLDIQRDMDLIQDSEPPATSQEVEPTVIDDAEANQVAAIGDATMSVGEEQTTTRPESPLKPAGQDAHASSLDDIANGLTLAPAMPPSTEPTPQMPRSSSPTVELDADDATMTMGLDDDTALLKDFLNRAATSKANKVVPIARRESLQNRRDSGAIRDALASPRKVLQDKDPNSPSKYDNDATLDLSQTLTLYMDSQPPGSPTQEQADTEDAEDTKSGRNSRRSSRMRKSRLPALASTILQMQTPKISIRRADGGEPIVLKRTEAQELGLMTRSNTRKNKQGCLGVALRLLKLDTEPLPTSVDEPARELKPGKKHVRWNSQLEHFQEGTDTVANMLAEAESLATPDELSAANPVSTPSAKPRAKQSRDKNSTPKIRRVRGLGTTNGTPGKALLAPTSFLPEAVAGADADADAKEAPPAQRLPKPKTSRVKKMPVAPAFASASASASTDTVPSTPSSKPLPSLEIAPVGIALALAPPQKPERVPSTKERKSRLATPKRVRLPPPTSSLPPVGKENVQRMGIAASPAKKSPKKSLPAPQVVIPAAVGGGAETGLPRRRGRKL
ncbi:hypothetical protein BDV95DRAFT_334926 [Massariosphaeria phaeospora]|uniref:Uncharacterized protein n=1 Tax=Massariosphaeria phaeospora TaxID=100035 RepID=A0A7C8IAE4_9PLEO|nr:hypothetical protein BDV95DRAFT_334926 [Massariosphaeria phaeospora]